MKMTKAEREAAESFHHWDTTAIEYKKTRIAKQQKQDEIDNESYAMVDNLNIVLAPLDIASWDHVIWSNGDANELECSTGDFWLKDPRKVAIRAVTEIRALRAYIAKQAKELKTAIELLEEVEWSHRDNNNPDYNQCDGDPCEFCRVTRTLMHSPVE